MVPKKYFFSAILFYATIQRSYATYQLLERHDRDSFIVEDLQTVNVSALRLTDKDHECYVRVAVLKNDNDPSPVPGATIIILSREINDTQNYKYYGYGTIYLGFTKGITGPDGYACIRTLCNKEALIFVEKNNERLYVSKNQNTSFPQNYFFRTQTRNEEMVIVPMDTGPVFGKVGPVYYKTEKELCMKGTVNESWVLVFAYKSVPDKLTKTIPDDNRQMSWYTAINYKACFLKVTVMTDSFETKLTATSVNDNNKNVYGTYETGPKASETDPDQTVRAACVEFRCPTDSSVTVNVTFSAKTSCNPKPTRLPPGARSALNTAVNTFSITIQTLNNYGPQNGIYIVQGVRSARTLAKQQCFAGANTITSEFAAKPAKQSLVTYTCMPNATNQPRPFGK